MTNYEANFEFKKNNLQFDGSLTKNKLQADLHITTKGKDKHFTYEQAIASAEWVIIHNLNKKPAITVVDSADTVWYGEYEYNDLNTVTLRFNAPFTGKAYLN